MSLAKAEVPVSAYIASGTKTASKGNSKRVAIKTAQELTTGRLLWIVVKRHRVGLLMVGNIVLVLNFAFPEWTQLVKSIF